MDSSFWTALNPNIRIKDTVRATYGNCLYRLAFRIGGAHLFRCDKTVDLSKAIIDHNLQVEPVRMSRYPVSLQVGRINEGNTKDLVRIRDCMLALPDSVNVRIEGQTVSLHSPNEQVLQDFARNPYVRRYIIEVTRPRDEEKKQLLLTGKILRKRKIQYRWRVRFKDGIVDHDTKSRLCSWISQQDKQVVSSSTKVLGRLAGIGTYIYDVYLDVDDERMITLLSLTYGSMIARIEEFSRH